MDQSITAHRGSIFHFNRVPDHDSDHDSYEFFQDGLLVVENGFVRDVGPYQKIKDKYPEGTLIEDHSGKILMPGFIDTHIHFPQTGIIASYGKQLMDWLETYTYPCETRFSDEEYAEETARFFMRELIRNGTTSALVMGTVHPESADVFFRVAESFNMRMISGKVMMDRNAPEGLRDTAETGYLETKTLIEKWHGKNRLSCAVTPRFAVTSTEGQLEAAGSLVREYQDVLLHTHLAENKEEVALIRRLFPGSRSYLDVYERFGLVGKRSVFAHSIHLDEDDLRTLKETDSAVSHCPTSNLFLGSGLFDMAMFEKCDIRISLGTDVGAGTSFSMLKTMGEAYKVARLKGYSLSPLAAFYLATLGGARAIGIDHAVGNFESGKEADFIVIDPNAVPVLRRRVDTAESIEDILFSLMILGDDRVVSGCYIMGERAD